MNAYSTLDWIRSCIAPEYLEKYNSAQPGQAGKDPQTLALQRMRSGSMPDNALACVGPVLYHSPHH